MRFLGLSGLQTLLLAAATAGTVIALYFLKLRHRRVFVSSSLLWRRVLDDQQSHSLIEKLRRLLSILLAVTIALLIALALARPEIEWLTGRNQRIVIILDTSPTMETQTSDGKTRWDHAAAQAESLLSSGGPTTEFRISDTSGRFASSFTTDRNEIRQLIRRMKPLATATKFPKIDSADSLVYFISDGVAVDQPPKQVRRISVFEKARNVGITAFEIRAKPSTPPGYEAYLEVQNFGADPTDAAVTLSGAGGQKINRTMKLAAGEAFQGVFDLTPFEGGVIRAAVLSKDDALSADDTAFGYLPMKRQTRTVLVTRGNSYLQTMLRLDPFVDLSVVDPASYHETADADVYIFDRFAPPSAPARPSLIIGAPEAPWLRPSQGIVQKPVVTTSSADHPLMQYVSIHDLSIQRATRIDAKDLTVIAASDRTPLIVASDHPRWVMLTFDLDSSDFPLHVGFPVFIDNVLAWFSRDQIALRREPGYVEVPLANAQIRTMDGKPVATQQQMNQTVFEAIDPGLYTATEGETHLHVAVNIGNKDYSDINRSSFRNDSTTASEQHLLRHELWFYMLFAAMLLVAGEWYTYHKRITL